jgi:rhamnosyltransferase subunit B
VVAALDPAAAREALMTQPARAVLVGLGSAGDLHPVIGIGRGLRERGWRVSVLSSPAYAQLTQRAGLDFVPIGDPGDYEATQAHPKLWHPIDGLGVLWRYLLRPALRPTFEAIRDLATSQRCVVFASPMCMGARVAQEALGTPLVSLYTSPTLLRSVEDPLTIASWRIPRAVPRAARRLAWFALDRWKLEPLVRPALDGLRAPLGLPPIDKPVFGSWMHSPQSGLALFPRWFAAPAGDWPRQVRQADFVMFDGSEPYAPSAAFTHFLDAGPAPVVVMPGTGKRASDPMFAAAMRAAEQLGVRMVLLGGASSALPRPAVHSEEYVPFSWLLQRARLLVHHGGVGSCAQALRAGVPQLLVPQAYDQFDNAIRLENLGVGRSVPRVEAIEGALRLLLSQADTQAHCAQWAGRSSPAGAVDAAQRIAGELA